jgi:transposase-like protein
VDQAGKTVDFYASRNREVAAAKAFLRKAMRQPRPPTKITLDSSWSAARLLKEAKNEVKPSRIT